MDCRASFFCLLWLGGRSAGAEEEPAAAQGRPAAETSVPSEEAADMGEEIRDGLLEDMDFTQVQDMLDEMLGGSFSFSGL